MHFTKFQCRFERADLFLPSALLDALVRIKRGWYRHQHSTHKSQIKTAVKIFKISNPSKSLSNIAHDSISKLRKLFCTTGLCPSLSHSFTHSFIQSFTLYLSAQIPLLNSARNRTLLIRFCALIASRLQCRQWFGKWKVLRQCFRSYKSYTK